jgi:hypothetical protein
MKKIIMFTGGIETQEYFTLQLAKAFEKFNHKVFLYRLDLGEVDFPALLHFIEEGHTVMITFNFHGLNREKPFYAKGIFLWEQLKLPCYNIVLDHPFYYHKFIAIVPPLYFQLSIDRGHENYMRRFFPQIKLGPFLPLAGTGLGNKPMKARGMDLVFTGNYTPPQQFDKHITRINQEYTQFYRGIIDDLLAHPAMEMDEAFEKHLLREMPGLNDGELKSCMENMIFIDLYVRFYFRGQVIRTLADNGLPVRVYGSGWELLNCKRPKNIILGKPADSLKCLEAIADSRISLNVMPWFKNGAHDRIFNSMLNGALCISDSSRWLKENLTDGQELVYYSLSKINELPSLVEGLLKDPDRLEKIADQGYKKALALHTWECRARVLEELIEGRLCD